LREAVGHVFIVNLILVFFAVISALLIGSLAYSKAFRVRNRIVYVIEKHGSWNVTQLAEGGVTINIVRNEIEHGLREIGYHMNLWNAQCPRRRDKGGWARLVYGNDGSDNIIALDSPYDFCVHEFQGGRYYGVTTFMHFNVPLIGGFLRFPVYGQTKPLLNLNMPELRN